MFEARFYTPADKDGWNKFLTHAKNATFLFHRDFMEYHADRYRDYSVVLWDHKGIISGIFPANLSENDCVVSHQGLSYGGLATGRFETLSNILRMFRELLHFLDRQGIHRLLYKELPAFYNVVPSEEHRYALFLADAVLYRVDTALSIRLPYQKEYDYHGQRKIQAAIKKGLSVQEETSMDYFWEQILAPNLAARYNAFPAHNLFEINLLKNRFPQNIRHFNAWFEGAPVAGTTIFETPTVAHAQYISANKQGLKVNALRFLFHTLIQETFANKLVFDFGICNEENGRALNHGLLFWKEDMGGRTYVHNFYEIDPSRYRNFDVVLQKEARSL